MNPVLDVCRSKSRHGNTAAALPVALCGAFLVLSGCASSPEPTAEMQAAKQAIADAESAQAAEHAAGELSQARTKLASASTAVQDKEMDEASAWPSRLGWTLNWLRQAPQRSRPRR